VDAGVKCEIKLKIEIKSERVVTQLFTKGLFVEKSFVLMQGIMYPPN
jgi:hypothetical protein